MDNLEPTGTVDNSSPNDAVATDTITTSTDAGSVAKSWKADIKSDYRNSPLLQKFEDTPEGLNKAIESHLNLEKLLGHEKVPIPKDANDVDGWNRFSKAMGIPDKAEGYGLPDAKFPESMKGMTIDKNKFTEIVHSHKLTPAQAKGLWDAYQQENINAYSKALEDHKKKTIDTVNRLKSEWGDTYETNVELGQMVINKFTDSQDMNDKITALLSGDPDGVKFLAKIGDQFAENKMGEFKMKKFSLAPEEAMEEARKMTMDLDGPYMNQKNKFTAREHQAAIDRYNHLLGVAMKAKG